MLESQGPRVKGQYKIQESQPKRSSSASNNEACTGTKSKNDTASKNNNHGSKRDITKEERGIKNDDFAALQKKASDVLNGEKPKKRIRPEDNNTFNSYSVLSEMDEDIPPSYVFERTIPKLKR